MKQDMITKRCLISEMSASSLQKYNLRIDEQPTTLKARVLQSPVIKFDPNGKNRTVSVKNGSFDLRDVLFTR